MSNRVQDAIDEMKERLKGMNGVGLNGKSLDELEDEQDLPFDEFFTFQNAQSRAFASGRITFDESVTLYKALGGEVYQDGWPEGTSLAVKVVVFKACAELMGIA